MHVDECIVYVNAIDSCSIVHVQDDYIHAPHMYNIGKVCVGKVGFVEGNWVVECVHRR